MEDEDTQSSTSKMDAFARNMTMLLGALAYLTPFLILESNLNYPDCFGVHLSHNGRAAVLEEWWYSYLLIQRHRFWDIVLFLYMWGPLLGLIGWQIWKWWKGRENKRLNLSIFDDTPPPSDPPPN